MPSTTAETPFVGRIDELAALTDALPAGRSPRARLWLVGGEPGIGKTRLVRELTRVAERHHSVSWGQCWHEAGTPPYWPWTQVIRRLQGVDSGTELASLVVANVDAETTAATDRFELFDATAAELRRASRRGPLVVVLDDLHRADPPTLQLTRFLLAHLTDVELLVVATYRPDEAENRDDIAVDLAALRAGAQTLSLSGLDADGVSAIVGDELLGEGVWALTGGNPLFVEQVLRAGAQRTAPSAEPDGRALGAVLRRRLDTLEPSALDLLAALAVLGPGASAEPVAALMELPADALTALVADLRGAGLVDRDELRLSHPLIAETAAECVAPERLARLHFAAATFGANNGAPAAERAHHLSRAGVDHWRDAVASRREAAAVAAASFAHDDAAAHLARAVELVEGHPEAIVTHFEVMLELAVARERTSGTLVAEDTYRRALELAQRTGDPRLIGRAAARHGIAFFADTRAQLDRAADCRAALAALPAGEEALRARLLANLAAADPAAADRSLYADEAVALARTIGDPEALGMALVAQQLVDLGPSTLASRFRSSREVIALAEWCGEPDLAVRGRFLLKNALLEAGDVRELDAELLAQDRTVTEIGEARFARHSLWFRCMRAMLDGRAVEAEDLAGQCLAIAQDLRDPDGFGVYTGQYGVALWLQGRLAELEPVYLDLMHDEPDEPLWPAVVGWIALSEGRLDTARGLLDRFPPPSQLPQGMHTLLNLFTMADIAAAVGDDELVADLRDVLLPYADRAVPIAMGAACFGVVARPLGNLAARLGRVDEAIAHFERAISVSARMGARPWLADAQLALAETLVASGRGADPRVAVLVDEAAATAGNLGLAVFERRLERLDRPAAAWVGPTGAKTPTDRGADRPEDGAAESSEGRTGLAEPSGTNTLRRRARVSVLGTFDVVTVDGQVSRWTSRKARALLKILIARRGTPIAREELMDLLWPDQSPDELTNRLAVAISTVRRALDPERTLPVDALIRADAGSVRLVDDHVEVDAEIFLTLGEAALAAHRGGTDDARRLLHGALDAYRGEAFPDEPYEQWAEALRSNVAVTCAALLRAVADRADADGDALLVSDALRRLLELDPYDEPAHLGLVESLRSLGAHGQARSARERYLACMAELGVRPAAEAAVGDDPVGGVSRAGRA